MPNRMIHELFGSSNTFPKITQFVTAQAIFIKAQALFNLCDFEHAAIMFHKGDRLQTHTDVFRYKEEVCKENYKVSIFIFKNGSTEL